jgi:uncharacterized membrane protein
MNLETSKNLGGIGAILIVIAFIGAFGYPLAGLLGLIGLILLLIGTKGLADHYSEQGIFNNALYAIILIIVGVVAAVGIFLAIALPTIAEDLPSLGVNASDWTAFSQDLSTVMQNFTDVSVIFRLIAAGITALIALFIFLVVSAFLYRRSLGAMATKTGVSMFKTAGLILLIGAVLTIILIGFVLVWIAFILIAVAFFSIRTTAAETPQPPQPPTS